MIPHTPGPWIAEDGGSERFEVNSNPADGGHWSAVAECRSNALGSRPVPVLEAHANARLIAAAPDLLKALRDVVDTFHDHPDRNEVSLEIARAVIAKAEGRS